MAEAILNRLGASKFHAYSAGSYATGKVNPLSLNLLRKMNYDVSKLRSKSWDEFAASSAPKLDFVFTVCDDAAGEVCPIWPGQPMTANWGLPDPAKATGTEAERAFAFDDCFRMLSQRIGIFVNLPLDSLEQSFAAKRARCDRPHAPQSALEERLDPKNHADRRSSSAFGR
jgi:protein-tyrosine-phosphatase